jgi:hypothetical protein
LARHIAPLEERYENKKAKNNVKNPIFTEHEHLEHFEERLVERILGREEIVVRIDGVAAIT